jgi:cell wall-associated NlpC family hydrolase
MPATIEDALDVLTNGRIQYWEGTQNLRDVLDRTRYASFSLFRDVSDHFISMGMLLFCCTYFRVGFVRARRKDRIGHVHDMLSKTGDMN